MKDLTDLEDLWKEHKNLIVLLPILEFEYPDVLEVIPRNSIVTPILLTNLVEYSLSCPSRYWTLLAVKWLENGFPINMTICNRLEDISLNEVDSQQLRHRAVNLTNKWKRTNAT